MILSRQKRQQEKLELLGREFLTDISKRMSIIEALYTYAKQIIAQPWTTEREDSYLRVKQSWEDEVCKLQKQLNKLRSGRTRMEILAKKLKNPGYIMSLQSEAYRLAGEHKYKGTTPEFPLLRDGC